MSTKVKSKTKRSVKKKIEYQGAVKLKKLFNAKKYNGIIKLKEDPLEIQKKLRNEWE